MIVYLFILLYFKFILNRPYTDNIPKPSLRKECSHVYILTSFRFGTDGVFLCHVNKGSVFYLYFTFRSVQFWQPSWQSWQSAMSIIILKKGTDRELNEKCNLQNKHVWAPSRHFLHTYDILKRTLIDRIMLII
jgi:hypothetical protein